MKEEIDFLKVQGGSIAWLSDQGFSKAADYIDAVSIILAGENFSRAVYLDERKKAANYFLGKLNELLWESDRGLNPTYLDFKSIIAAYTILKSYSDFGSEERGYYSERISFYSYFLPLSFSLENMDPGLVSSNWHLKTPRYKEISLYLLKNYNEFQKVLRDGQIDQYLSYWFRMDPEGQDIETYIEKFKLCAEYGSFLRKAGYSIEAFLTEFGKDSYYESLNQKTGFGRADNILKAIRLKYYPEKEPKREIKPKKIEEKEPAQKKSLPNIQEVEEKREKSPVNNKKKTKESKKEIIQKAENPFKKDSPAEQKEFAANLTREFLNNNEQYLFSYGQSFLKTKEKLDSDAKKRNFCIEVYDKTNNPIFLGSAILYYEGGLKKLKQREKIDFFLYKIRFYQVSLENGSFKGEYKKLLEEAGQVFLNFLQMDSNELKPQDFFLLNFIPYHDIPEKDKKSVSKIYQKAFNLCENQIFLIDKSSSLLLYSIINWIFNYNISKELELSKNIVENKIKEPKTLEINEKQNFLNKFYNLILPKFLTFCEKNISDPISCFLDFEVFLKGSIQLFEPEANIAKDIIFLEKIRSILDKHCDKWQNYENLKFDILFKEASHGIEELRRLEDFRKKLNDSLILKETSKRELCKEQEYYTFIYKNTLNLYYQAIDLYEKNSPVLIQSPGFNTMDILFAYQDAINMSYHLTVSEKDKKTYSDLYRRFSTGLIEALKFIKDVPEEKKLGCLVTIYEKEAKYAEISFSKESIEERIGRAKKYAQEVIDFIDQKDLLDKKEERIKAETTMLDLDIKYSFLPGKPLEAKIEKVINTLGKINSILEKKGTISEDLVFSIEELQFRAENLKNALLNQNFLEKSIMGSCVNTFDDYG